jgi:hypothetical protein
MVHALRALWRVLAERGTLVDVRPLSARCPLEAVSADALVQIGELDAAGMMADDAAADDAIRQSIDEGWFVSLRKTTFDFAYYWDSVAEMTSMLSGRKRTKQITPSPADLERSYEELIARHSGGIRLRCRTPMLLAVYEKADYRARRTTNP